MLKDYIPKSLKKAAAVVLTAGMFSPFFSKPVYSQEKPRDKIEYACNESDDPVSGNYDKIFPFINKLKPDNQIYEQNLNELNENLNKINDPKNNQETKKYDEPKPQNTANSTVDMVPEFYVDNTQKEKPIEGIVAYDQPIGPEKPVSHIVKKGDNLHRIAKKYGQKDLQAPYDICEVNNLKNCNLIYPDQELIVPFYNVEQEKVVSKPQNTANSTVDMVPEFYVDNTQKERSAPIKSMPESEIPKNSQNQPNQLYQPKLESKERSVSTKPISKSTEAKTSEPKIPKPSQVSKPKNTQKPKTTAIGLYDTYGGILEEDEIERNYKYSLIIPNNIEDIKYFDNFKLIDTDNNGKADHIKFKLKKIPKQARAITLLYKTEFNDNDPFDIEKSITVPIIIKTDKSGKETQVKEYNVEVPEDLVFGEAFLTQFLEEPKKENGKWIFNSVYLEKGIYFFQEKIPTDNVKDSQKKKTPKSESVMPQNQEESTPSFNNQRNTQSTGNNRSYNNDDCCCDCSCEKDPNCYDTCDEQINCNEDMREWKKNLPVPDLLTLDDTISEPRKRDRIRDRIVEENLEERVKHPGERIDDLENYIAFDVKMLGQFNYHRVYVQDGEVLTVPAGTKIKTEEFEDVDVSLRHNSNEEDPRVVTGKKRGIFVPHTKVGGRLNFGESEDMGDVESGQVVQFSYRGIKYPKVLFQKMPDSENPREYRDSYNYHIVTQDEEVADVGVVVSVDPVAIAATAAVISSAATALSIPASSVTEKNVIVSPSPRGGPQTEPMGNSKFANLNDQPVNLFKSNITTTKTLDDWISPRQQARQARIKQAIQENRDNWNKLKQNFQR